jgi:hypothetical protein
MIQPGRLFIPAERTRNIRPCALELSRRSRRVVRRRVIICRPHPRADADLMNGTSPSGERPRGRPLRGGKRAS